MKYIVYAIPVFFILILVELVFAWVKKRDYYRLNDAVNDLSCGIAQQVLGVFMKTVLFAGYLYLYDHYAMLEISSTSVLGWVVLFFGVDFFYYWFHRMSHEINALWGGHIVHHQSEEYNLAVALRQGSFQAVFSWVFYLPLAVAGFPPAMFASMAAFNTLYQFWIHTRAIGKLGPLEWFWNTPSHHRVHHGRNPKYLDKNHAGTLIIWDRMFGTFQEEDEEVVYGITKPLNSWNPIWANLHYFVELYRDARRAKRWTDKIKIWFMPPEWRPEPIELEVVPEVSPESYVKYNRRVSIGLGIYIFVQFVGVNLAMTAFMRGQAGMSDAMRAGIAGWILVSLVSFGGLFDSRSWAMGLELVRLVVTAVGGVAIMVLMGGSGDWAWVGGGAAAACIACVYWLTRYRREGVVSAEPAF